ncbi:MAG: hypothetical protein Q4D91_11785 [Lautropia sp.]|nr:hypothetical protein [Lautropia sp.]
MSGQGWVVLASGMAGDEDALPLGASARVMGARLRAGDALHYRFDGAGRRAYLVPAHGAVEISGMTIGPRDGAAIHDEPRIVIEALADTDLLMVECAAAEALEGEMS